MRSEVDGVFSRWTSCVKTIFALDERH